MRIGLLITCYIDALLLQIGIGTLELRLSYGSYMSGSTTAVDAALQLKMRPRPVILPG